VELPSLINQLLRKAAPTSALENQRINDDCKLWYEKLVKKTTDKQAAGETLTLIDKLVLQMDSWYFRLGLAMSYFVILRFIQDMMNPGDDPKDTDIHN
jgi:hypothetical protein